MPDYFTLSNAGLFSPWRFSLFSSWGLRIGSHAIQLLGKLHIDSTGKVVAFYHKVFLLYIS